MLRKNKKKIKLNCKEDVEKGIKVENNYIKAIRIRRTR